MKINSRDLNCSRKIMPAIKTAVNFERKEKNKFSQLFMVEMNDLQMCVNFYGYSIGWLIVWMTLCCIDSSNKQISPTGFCWFEY